MNKKINRWARHFDACRGCDSTRINHRSDGLCQTCFGRMRYRMAHGIPLDQPKWSRGHREELPEIGSLLKELGHDETRAKMEALEMKDGQWIIGTAKEHAERLARIYGSPSEAHWTLTANEWDTERRIEKADREFRKAVMFCLQHEGAAV